MPPGPLEVANGHVVRLEARQGEAPQRRDVAHQGQARVHDLLGRLHLVFGGALLAELLDDLDGPLLGVGFCAFVGGYAGGFALVLGG